jgi:membrane protein YqaA with SNARE-associated domain
MNVFRNIFQSVAGAIFHLGGVGLLIVGIIDSSFLTAPLANDFLVIALTANHPHRMPFYALMATAGSTLGCLSVDIISRKANEKVEAKVASRTLRFVESQFRRHAGWAVVLASLTPPPFPFTPFVALAAGTGYARKKLLGLVAVSRYVRFAAEGALAIFYGQGILRIAQSRGVEYTVIALIVIAIGGSSFTIVRAIQKARRGSGGRQQVQQPQNAH